jgi:hypothetical protein
MKKLQSYYDPKYDSDEELDENTRKKIEDSSSPMEADKVREEAWGKQDTYPKLKRLVKGAWYGDKRK